jgi:hypothetical protein
MVMKMRSVLVALVAASSVLFVCCEGEEGMMGEEVMCRHKRYLPASLFQVDTCGWCYKYMPNRPITFGHPSRKLNHTFLRWPHPQPVGNETTVKLYPVLTLLGINDSLVSYNVN